MSITAREVALIRRSIYPNWAGEEPIYDPPITEEEVEDYRAHMRQDGLLDDNNKWIGPERGEAGR